MVRSPHAFKCRVLLNAVFYEIPETLGICLRIEILHLKHRYVV